MKSGREDRALSLFAPGYVAASEDEMRDFETGAVASLVNQDTLDGKRFADKNTINIIGQKMVEQSDEIHDLSGELVCYWDGDAFAAYVCRSRKVIELIWESAGQYDRIARSRRKVAGSAVEVSRAQIKTGLEKEWKGTD